MLRVEAGVDGRFVVVVIPEGGDGRIAVGARVVPTEFRGSTGDARDARAGVSEVVEVGDLALALHLVISFWMMTNH